MKMLPVSCISQYLHWWPRLLWGMDLQLLKFHMASTLVTRLLKGHCSKATEIRSQSFKGSDLENAIYDHLLLYLNQLKDNVWCTCKVIQMTSLGKGSVG